MKTKLLLLCTSGLIIVTGCGSTPPPHRPNYHATSVRDVQVAIMDATPRAASQVITPFLPANAPKAFTVLAHLTVQGYAADEATLVNYLTSKARELGANGIVMGPAGVPFHGWPASATDQTLRVYRAEAILYPAK